MKFGIGEWRMRNGEKAVVTHIDTAIRGIRCKDQDRLWWELDGKFHFLAPMPHLDLIEPWDNKQKGSDMELKFFPTKIPEPTEWDRRLDGVTLEISMARINAERASGTMILEFPGGRQIYDVAKCRGLSDFFANLAKQLEKFPE